MVGMWIVVTVALGGVANHVLNPTTGNGMGYLAIAMTFGFAFAFSIIGFGAVSAMLNPAAALMQVCCFFVVVGFFCGVCVGVCFCGVSSVG